MNNCNFNVETVIHEFYCMGNEKVNKNNLWTKLCPIIVAQCMT